MSPKWTSPLPRYVVFDVATTKDLSQATLYDVEEKALGKNAGALRRKSFSLGRASARRSLDTLSILKGAITIGQRGQPVWPPGIIGSISHTQNVATSVVARRSDCLALGIDVESEKRKLSPGVQKRICRPEESLWLKQASTPWLPLAVFSAKESIFKAFYPLNHTELVFQDAQLTWLADRHCFQAILHRSASPGYPSGYRFPVFVWRQGGLIFTAVVLASTFSC
jgi:4'-phosphopantetheinyl transferase EntD